MDILTHTTRWVSGEVLQGKTTIALSIICTIIFLYFSNFHQSFYKGLAIPFFLFQWVLLGYGVFQVSRRPDHIEKVSQGMETAPQETLKAELIKAQKDNNAYSMVKIIWVIMIAISGALYFMINSGFWKGISLGFALFFVGMFIFDGFLQYRLKPYLSALESLNIQ